MRPTMEQTILKEHEYRVLAGMIHFPEQRFAWLNVLNKTHFLTSDNKFMFDVISEKKDLFEDDLFTALRSDGIKNGYETDTFIDFVYDRGMGCGETVSLNEIMRFKRYRDLKEKFNEIDSLDPKESDIQALYEDVVKVADDVELLTIKDCFRTLGTEFINKSDSTKPKYTGMEEYDELMGGFVDGMHIITGRAGKGKSSLAAQVLMEFSDHNPNKVQIFFSAEMGKRSIARRVTSYQAKIDSSKIKTGKFTDTEGMRFINTGEKVKENCYFIECKTICAQEAEQIIKKVRERSGLEVGLLCFDYLQKLSPNNKKVMSETEWFTRISADYTELAKSYPMLMVSNLTKDQDPSVCPSVKELKGSSSIEYDATSVLALWSPDPESRADVVCSRMLKHREGEPQATITWNFDGSITKFFFKSWGEPQSNKKKTNHNPF